MAKSYRRFCSGNYRGKLSLTDVARDGLCYEPLSGSGSQIIAGEANGRRVFAMEISPAYIDVAGERWQVDTGRDAVLDGDGRSFAQVRTKRLGDAAVEEAAA